MPRFIPLTVPGVDIGDTKKDTIRHHRAFICSRKATLSPAIARKSCAIDLPLVLPPQFSPHRPNVKVVFVMFCFHQRMCHFVVCIFAANESYVLEFGKVLRKLPEFGKQTLDGIERVPFSCLQLLVRIIFVDGIKSCPNAELASPIMKVYFVPHLDRFELILPMRNSSKPATCCFNISAYKGRWSALWGRSPKISCTFLIFAAFDGPIWRMNLEKSNPSP